MKPISTILTLLILVLPVLVILTLFAVIIYVYRTSFEASAILSSLSASLSVILVNLLVWERLRDSLSKKLEYLHKNLLFKLYSIFGSSDLIYFQQDDIKSIRDDLERYGKFMGISLYPRNLLKEIDKLLSFHSEFRKRTEMVIKLAQEVIGESDLNRRLFWGLIGIRQDDASARNPQERQMYEEKVEIIKKERPQLIEEMIHYDEKMVEITKRLLNKLENFLKTNNLRLEEERTYPLYRY
jgi:hypothetical protein